MPIFHPRRVGRKDRSRRVAISQEEQGRRRETKHFLARPLDSSRGTEGSREVFLKKKEKNMMDTMRTGRKFLMAPVPIVDCSSPYGNSIRKAYCSSIYASF